MQTHQQGKTGAGKLRTKIFSIIVVLIMLLGVAITLARIVPAKADTTGDYPYASIACVWSPYATTDTGNWCKKVDTSGKIISYQTPFKNAAFAARASHSFECKEVSDYDGGTIHNNNSSKSEQSPYGYDYRNCTDYVAWKVASLGVPPTHYQGLRNAKDWPAKAPSKGLTVNTTPAIGAAAVKTTGTYGHIAFISAYNGSTGVITVQEYNNKGDGNYGTRSGTLSSLGFSEVVHFEKYETSGSPTSPTPIPSATSRGALNGIAAVSTRTMATW